MCSWCPLCTFCPYEPTHDAHADFASALPAGYLKNYTLVAAETYTPEPVSGLPQILLRGHFPLLAWCMLSLGPIRVRKYSESTPSTKDSHSLYDRINLLVYGPSV